MRLINTGKPGLPNSAADSRPNLYFSCKVVGGKSAAGLVALPLSAHKKKEAGRWCIIRASSIITILGHLVFEQGLNSPLLPVIVQIDATLRTGKVRVLSVPLLYIANQSPYSSAAFLSLLVLCSLLLPAYTRNPLESYPRPTTSCLFLATYHRGFQPLRSHFSPWEEAASGVPVSLSLPDKYSPNARCSISKSRHVAPSCALETRRK